MKDYTGIVGQAYDITATLRTPRSNSGYGVLVSPDLCLHFQGGCLRYIFKRMALILQAILPYDG